MAVAKSLPRVKITICSEGKKLKEYKFKKETPCKSVDKAVSRLIEASTGAEFSIKIHVTDSYQLDSPNLLFNMYVDGVSVGGVLCGEYELIHGSWTKNVEGVKQPTEKRNVVGLRKFRFSELVIENGYSPTKLAEDRKSALRIGEVQVQVHRCSSFYTLPRGPVDVRSDLPTISEKALEKREISHGTTYSPAKRVLENATFYDVTYVDGEDNPLAVFNFSYRSKEILEKELLREANEGEHNRETVGKKRKRNEQVDKYEDEDITSLSDGNELFVSSHGSARRARKPRKSGESAEIETINLIDDLEEK